MQDQQANSKDQWAIFRELNINVYFFLTGWFANIRKTSGTAIFIIRQYGRVRTHEFLNTDVADCETPLPSLQVFCGWEGERGMGLRDSGDGAPQDHAALEFFLAADHRQVQNRLVRVYLDLDAADQAAFLVIAFDLEFQGAGGSIGGFGRG